MPEIVVCDNCGTWNWRVVGEEFKHLCATQEEHRLNKKPKTSFFCVYCWHYHDLWIEVIPEEKTGGHL